MRWKKINYNELIWKTIGSIYIQWIWKKAGYHQRIIWKCLKCWEKDTTIDRIDWNWNYCKENCRWATYKEQYLNQEKHKVKTI